MNTIKITASINILAIDLGKYKSVVCILDRDTSSKKTFTVPGSGEQAS